MEFSPLSGRPIDPVRYDTARFGPIGIDLIFVMQSLYDIDKMKIARVGSEYRYKIPLFVFFCPSFYYVDQSLKYREEARIPLSLLRNRAGLHPNIKDSQFLKAVTCYNICLHPLADCGDIRLAVVCLDCHTVFPPFDHPFETIGEETVVKELITLMRKRDITKIVSYFPLFRSFANQIHPVLGLGMNSIYDMQRMKELSNYKLPLYFRNPYVLSDDVLRPVSDSIRRDILDNTTLTEMLRRIRPTV